MRPAVRVIVERSQRDVRFWAYDIARYFHLDPTSVLRTWSVGDLVEATHALRAYEAIRSAQEAYAQESQSSFGSGTGNGLGAWH